MGPQRDEKSAFDECNSFLLIHLAKHEQDGAFSFACCYFSYPVKMYMGFIIRNFGTLLR